ncbi:protein-lysine N-methyltransferase EEF2KMT isoform X1 [Polyodon spathula]|uniref:protein-lysine N-methyltransferase EEF2KMT isoform X1 n=1 Tax=Polyodon spathula TaxID=7913 RepID=UPI001B7D9170|nr:protein-lysine N-methyltransferase EEF2KMT isoform X1 [Polyodon spathula]
MNNTKELEGETENISISCVGDENDLFTTFQVSFFAMCRLGSFPWNEFEAKLKSSDSSPVLQEILKKTVCHPVCRRNPPSVKYRRLFLQEIIKRHEATLTEPLDELYDALAEVLGAEEGKVCHKNYLLPSGDVVSLAESVAVISEGTTGLVTWEAGLCLAEWALELPQVFKDRSVLELGSGVGLTGIALCKSCSPKRYTFSDCHPTVLQQLQSNVERNGLAVRGNSVADSSSAGVGVAVEGLDWETVSQEQLQDLQADVVIASDVVYDPEIVCCLVGLLSKLLSCTVKDSIPEVYISSTIRNPETYSFFKTELGKIGIRQQAIPGPTRQVFPYNRSLTVPKEQIAIFHPLLCCHT